MRIRGLIAILSFVGIVLALSGSGAAKKTGEEPALPEGHEIVGTFGNWEARTFPLEDGASACAADSLSMVQRKDTDQQWLSVVWGDGETTGYLYLAPSPALAAEDQVTYAIAGSNYIAYVQEGAAYLHDEDNLAVLRHLARENPLTVELRRAGDKAVALAYSPQGFLDTYEKIAEVCGFSTAEVAGEEDEWQYAHAGRFGQWTAATWKSAAGERVCDAESVDKSDPDGGPDLYLSYKNEQSPYGYLVYSPKQAPLQAADRVSASVGGQSFDMFVDQGRAFPYEENDAALIRALAAAPSVEIEVAPEGGKTRSHSYSLDGFLDAYRQIGKLCSFATDWLEQPAEPSETAETTEPAETTETVEAEEPPVEVEQVAVITPALTPEQVTEQMRQERRVALVIGNAEYGDRYGLATLRAPDNDAAVMSETLEELGFEITTVIDADLDAMEAAVDDFARALRKGGVGLFYFSGHGMQTQGQNFLFPIGSRMEREDDVHMQTLPVETILSVMQKAGNRLNIVILDACRSNPFSDGSRTRAQGLAAVTAPEASEIVIAYAAAAGRNAFEPVEPGFTLGHYTAALVEALKVPGLEMEYVFRQARAATRKRTEGDQIPWTSTSVEGFFYFRLP